MYSEETKGEILTRLRETKKLTQEEFVADFNKKTDSNLKRPTYANYETDRRNRIDRAILIKLANYHGVSLDYLEGNKTEEVSTDLGNVKKLTFDGRELTKEEVDQLYLYVKHVLLKQRSDK